MTPPGLSHRQFAERVIIGLAILGLALLLWSLRGLIILIFGAMLFAVILRTIANPLRDGLHVPDWLALLAAVLLVFGLVGLASALFGAEIIEQAQLLQMSLPEAWQAIERRLDAIGLGEPAEQWFASLQGGPDGGILSSVSNLLMSVGSAVTDTVLVMVGGIFLAVDPRLYRNGLIKLVPEEGRDRLSQALEDCWKALRLWLLGRLATMLVVGILTGLGLWWLDMPASLTLGLAAGLLDFIPFVGPILAAIPAILLALASDPTTALWVAGLYLLIQQIEGNVVTPIFQKQAVELPPALLLFSLVACGLVFGVPGIIFAEPLTVVIFVLIKRLYVRDALHTQTPIPGETKD